MSHFLLSQAGIAQAVRASNDPEWDDWDEFEDEFDPDQVELPPELDDDEALPEYGDFWLDEPADDAW